MMGTYTIRRLRQKYRAASAVLGLLAAVGLAPGQLQAAQAAPSSPPAKALITTDAQTGSRVTFGIKPSHATTAKPLDERSRFSYSATPGAVQSDFVAISNNALTPVHLTVYASDGFNTESGGFDLLAASRKAVDVGSWITMKTNVVDIEPNGTVVVPFTLRVPAKVGPGDHVGGIVASLRTTQVDKKGNRVAIDSRVGARIYLRIQGPLDPGLAIVGLKAKYHGSWWNPFTAGKVTISYGVRNTGNVRLGAHQSVTVSGWYGTVHSSSPADIAELLPDNVHNEQLVITHVVPSFRGKAVVDLDPFSLPGDTDGRLSRVVASAHYWAIPWAFLLLVLVVLLLLLMAFLRWRRRRKPATATAVGGPGGSKAAVGAVP